MYDRSDPDMVPGRSLSVAVAPMNLWLVLFGVVLAVILAQANHGVLAMIIGGGALACLVVVPWIEHAITADRIRPRPPPRSSRRPGRRR